MKALYTSDIHAHDTHLFTMLSAAENEGVDCIIIGGDIVPHNLPGAGGAGPFKLQAAYLKDVFIPAVRRFKERHATEFYLDLGNDDFQCNRPILEQYDGVLFNLLHYKKQSFTEDIDIVGYMNVPPTPFTRKDLEKPDSRNQPSAPGNEIILEGFTSKGGVLRRTTLDLASDDTIENDLARLSEGIDRPFIFVSHSPPYHTSLDVLYNGVHAGSVGIRDFIKQWALKGLLIAAFHGHIHESFSRSGTIATKIGNVWCFNPGQGSSKGSGFNHMIFRLEDKRFSWES